MRTKTLLLTAALSAAGVATSMAQVYSQNAVGYINLSIPQGFSLIANQLIAPSYTLSALIPNPPPNTIVYKLVGASYSVSTFDEFDLAWLNNGVASTDTIDLGGGVWIFAPSAFTATFVGEVPQGTLNTPTPTGFSIRSSQVPQAGDLVTLGLTAAANDAVYRFKPATASYDVFIYDEFDLVWTKDGIQTNPPVNVGEAVFLQRQAGSPTTWVRTFSVN